MKAPFWTCDKRGDCCREPAFVMVTDAEAAELERAKPARVTLQYLEHRDGFKALKTGPCPLLNDDGSCSVYEVRPYNCRRFVCLRAADEPWIRGPLGECVNLDRWLNISPQAATFYASHQRHAQVWAKAHGWSDTSARA